MKTTATDLDKVSAYLKNQVGWVEIDKIKKAIPPKHVHGFKVEAMKYLGLLERDGENVKLTTEGRDYAAGDAAQRAQVMRDRLKSIPLYNATLEWMHFNDKTDVSKTDIANYWHDKHPTETSGATGDALTDSAVFFMRMVGVAELGKFVAAGAGRDTHLEMDAAQLAAFATGAPAPIGEEEEPPADVPPPAVRAPALNVGAGLNVNVEIHIAADAKPATIEEIFKNMRKYLLEPDATQNGG
jgi:C-terminal AAA-associated domain